MRKITFKVSLGIGFSGAVHEDILEVEVENDASEQDIEQAKEEITTEWSYNYIDCGFGENLTDEIID